MGNPREVFISPTPSEKLCKYAQNGSFVPFEHFWEYFGDLKTVCYVLNQTIFNWLVHEYINYFFILFYYELSQYFLRFKLDICDKEQNFQFN